MARHTFESYESIPVVEKFCSDMEQLVSQSTITLYNDRISKAMRDWQKDYDVSVIQSEAYGTDVFQIFGINKVMLGVWWKRMQEGMAPASVNNNVSAVRKFIHWCYEREVLVGTDGNAIKEDLSNILHCVKVLAKDEQAPDWDNIHEEEHNRALSSEDVQKLMSLLGRSRYGVRDQCIASAMLFAGLRTNEVIELTYGGVVKFREKNQFYCKRKGGHWCFTEVHPEFYKYLDAYLDSTDYNWQYGDPLFRAMDGSSIGKSTIYTLLAKAQRELGLPTGGHALRAAFASEVNRIGGPAIARDALNHKTLVVTQRYLDTTSEERASVVAQLSFAS